MRVTNSLFYSSAINNYQNSMEDLYKANNQISSGLKIQNSFEDSGTYVDTMRLDYEVATLEQVSESASKAETYANNTDDVMNQFTDALTEFRTLLLQAANETNSSTSLDAIANDLEGLKDHMISLGNTSINGQYLFAGTDITNKPLDEYGNYSGNGESIEALIGSGVTLPYNINGEDLFMGYDSDYNKTLSTNVKMLNQSDDTQTYITETSTILDMIGESTNNPNAMFYVSGRTSAGDTFSERLELSSSSTVSDLLEQIGDLYGNTSTNSVVDVSMNDSGQIEIKDLNDGDFLLEMNIFGAVDRSAASGTAGAADVGAGGDTDTLASATDVDIIEFIKSDFTSSASIPDSINYDRYDFEKDGNELTSNISQIVVDTNEYATASTKLSEVSNAVLNGTSLELNIVDTDGDTNVVTIDFTTSDTEFTIDDGVPPSSTYTLFNATGGQTGADDVTYQQISDIISMVASNNVPSSNTFTDYQSAVSSASDEVEVNLDNKGRLTIYDSKNSESAIEFSMYDADTSNASTGSTLSFMANNLVTTEEPSIDFFEDINMMIDAVRSGTYEMDSEADDPRNIGIQNSISRIDHIIDNTTKEHTKIGSYTNALTHANERSELLNINVQSIRSEVIDVDMAEAYMNFTQLSTSYEASLSTISKINSMSLLNYM